MVSAQTIGFKHLLKWDHYLSLTLSPAGWAPLDCNVPLSRAKESLKHRLFQFYKRNKYLSTKIAHLSDRKWGRVLHWSPDVQAEDVCLFSIWAGQSLKKYVRCRRAAANWTAPHMVPDFSFMFCFFLTATRQSDFLLLGLRLHSRGGLKRDFSLMCNSFEKECKKKKMIMTNMCV